MTTAKAEPQHTEALVDGYQVLTWYLLDALADRCPRGQRVTTVAQVLWEGGVLSDGGGCIGPELCSLAARDFARLTHPAGRLMRLVLGHMAREEAKQPQPAEPNLDALVAAAERGPDDPF